MFLCGFSFGTSNDFCVKKDLCRYEHGWHSFVQYIVDATVVRLTCARKPFSITHH